MLKQRSKNILICLKCSGELTLDEEWRDKQFRLAIDTLKLLDKGITPNDNKNNAELLKIGDKIISNLVFICRCKDKKGHTPKNAETSQ